MYSCRHLSISTLASFNVGHGVPSKVRRETGVFHGAGRLQGLGVESDGGHERNFAAASSAGAAMPWVSSSAEREGYLVSGDYQHVECALGEELAGPYAPGGYFLRPAGIVNGGPLSGGPTSAVWFLRESKAGSENSHDAGCELP